MHVRMQTHRQLSLSLSLSLCPSQPLHLSHQLRYTTTLSMARGGRKEGRERGSCVNRVCVWVHPSIHLILMHVCRYAADCPVGVWTAQSGSAPPGCSQYRNKTRQNNHRTMNTGNVIAPLSRPSADRSLAQTAIIAATYRQTEI